MRTILDTDLGHGAYSSTQFIMGMENHSVGQSQTDVQSVGEADQPHSFVLDSLTDLGWRDLV